MGIASIKPVEKAVHATNAWLKELMEELRWEDGQRAYHALRVVLHTLRDHLTVAEAVDLGAQLPLLICGMYYEGWKPNHRPVSGRSKEQFLAAVGAAFAGDPEVYPEGVVWSVFKVLQRHVSSGEIGDVKHVLPAPIRSLWPVSDVACVT
jgi:uncharacterized protein (DUF2267 family)